MALDSSFRYGYIRKFRIVSKIDPALQDNDGPIKPIKIHIFRKRIVCKVVPPKAIVPIADDEIFSEDGKRVRTRRKRKPTAMALELKTKKPAFASNGDSGAAEKAAAVINVAAGDAKPKKKVPVQNEGLVWSCFAKSHVHCTAHHA